MFKFLCWEIVPINVPKILAMGQSNGPSWKKTKINKILGIPCN
jgi:hypothetical protein